MKRDGWGKRDWINLRMRAENGAGLCNGLDKYKIHTYLDKSLQH